MVNRIVEPAPGRLSGRWLAAVAALALFASASGNGPRAQETPGAPAQETPGASQSTPAQATPKAEPGAPQEETPGAAPGASQEETPGAPAEAGPVQHFQDWDVRCGQPKGQPQEMCEMFQERANKEGHPLLGAWVGKVLGSANPGMLIMLPLGIELPEGVALKIDDGREIPVHVRRCERRGCRVELLLEPDLLATLKGGRQVTVVFHVFRKTGVQQVGVPISLLGFTAALDQVMNPA